MNDLFVALAHALTGQQVAAPGIDDGTPTAEQVVRGLAAGGWDQERLVAHREQRQRDREPWPHPVPEGIVVPWGQFGSLLRQVRSDLGLDGLRASVHQGPKVLGPVERRLLADKPPHHG